jgi:hypothetical protein
VSLSLSDIFIGAPLTAKAADVLSIDLPLHGNMTVPPARVTSLPYVGTVDLISDLDSSNVNIQSSGDTLVIRGSVSALSSAQLPPAAWSSGSSSSSRSWRGIRNKQIPQQNAFYLCVLQGDKDGEMKLLVAVLWWCAVTACRVEPVSHVSLVLRGSRS